MANVSSFSGAMPVIPGGLVELGYLEKTSTVSVNTGSGSQTSVIGPLTIVSDGSPLMVEFFCEEAAAPATAGAYLLAALWVDGAENTRTMGVAYGGATGSNHGETLHAVRRITLSAGSHTVEVKGWSSAAANFYAGAGGTASYAPMFLRVSKIVNQNDGLKPFWTPPVVTQLPSQAVVGDQVIFAADATNGVYWTLYYDGLGTYPWKFVGGAPLHAITGSGSQTASNNYITTNIPQLTIPLSGDYSFAFGGYAQKASGTAGTADMRFGLHVNGVEKESVAESAYTIYDGGSPWGNVRVTGISASHVADVRYKTTNSLNSAFSAIRLSTTPIRVSA